MKRVVEITPSTLVEMITERLQDYDRDDLVRFWDKNFGNDPKVEVDEDGDWLLATHEQESLGDSMNDQRE